MLSKRAIGSNVLPPNLTKHGERLRPSSLVGGFIVVGSSGSL